MNRVSSGMVRAFSAGLVPAGSLNSSVPKLLSAHGASAKGLGPKSVDVFLQPHAPMPDIVVHLEDLKSFGRQLDWVNDAKTQVWDIVSSPYRDATSAVAADCFQKIRACVDQIIDPKAHGAARPEHPFYELGLTA
ncbi:hypothetical protein E1178_13410 [Roseibium hamelinense]|uniref:hypothetical protein n=1 Tax=Roseibium hamelinense TaxID=150831 RepID=UPI00119F1B24|nr:hypothetical protein [Roseibium hamelinense]MTI44607.1 hypothetical protein [Roseibium hamelinense]